MAIYCFTSISFSMKRPFLSLSISLLFFGFLHAQSPGSLDLTFGGTGYVTKDVLSENNISSEVFLQPDGKIVTLGNSGNSFGYTSVVALRYLSDGTLDPGFGNAGVFREASFGYPVSSIDYCELWSGALQTDGKVVLAGIFHGFNIGLFTFIIRLNANGTKDASFGTNGLFVAPVINYAEPRDKPLKIGILQDGKIILFTGVKSTDKFSLLRVNANGTSDAFFGVNGWLDVPSSLGPVFSMTAVDLLVQPDGKILVSGTAATAPNLSKGYIFRFFPDGTFDNSLSSNCELLLSGGSRIALYPDGKMLLNGFQGLSRYHPDGSIDNTFGSNGTVQIPLSIRNCIVQMDGKIVCVGIENGRAYLLRRKADGSSDQSFGNSGGGYILLPAPSMYNEVLQQPDGKLVACGVKDANFLLGRHFSQTVSASEEVEIFQQFAFGPNPSSGDFSLHFQLAEAQKMSISLFDLTGQLVRTLEPENILPSGEHNIAVNISDLPAGNYVVRIEGDQGEKSLKIQLLGKN